MFSEFDHQHMARAIELAKRGWYSTTPNPRVGCVLVKDDRVIAEGWHERAGEAHAEAMALQRAGEQALGSTAYVTLEPCSFVGRTPACANSLIQAGIAKVICAMRDPHSKVAGEGIAALQAAGIEVQVGLLGEQATKLNPGYIKRHTEGLPQVICKMAMSLDGRTAMASGESQWITGVEARTDVQRLRAESCAILTGINTVLADDPRLTVRPQELGAELASRIKDRQPLRLVFDSQARCPASAKILSAPGETVLAVGSDAQISPALQSSGVELLVAEQPLPEPRTVLEILARRGCNTVLLETGAVLAGRFLQQGLVDELVIYVAGKLMGSTARPLFDLPIETMAGSIAIDMHRVRLVGQDLRIDARPSACH